MAKSVQRRVVRSRWPAVLYAIGLLVPAAAQAEHYDRHVLTVGEPAGAELARFAELAAEALRRISGTYSSDEQNRALINGIFTETVVIYAGGTELTDSDGFVHRGRFAREAVLAALGGLMGSDSTTPRGREMDGGYLLGGMLADGMIGASPEMDGETCTGSFERLPVADMRALLEATGTQISSWGVASVASDDVQFHGGPPLQGWGVGDLVHFDLEAAAIRSCCWAYVVTPDGGGAYVQMMGGSPIAPYLASHVCFTRTADGWRISAIAIRLPGASAK